jgi:serine/threonine-protein kinase ULK/ATG1
MLKTANNMYLVYEFCDGGTLEDILQKRHHLPEAEALVVFQQLVNAFKAIYSENILHRDLKPSNILIHNGVYKIADFGFCKKMTGAQEMTYTMVGSPIYMAPEVLKGFAYNIKADVWSLGVCLYEMLYGICPYEEKTLPALINIIDTKSLTFHPEINPISPNTENLLRKMLTQDFSKRMEWTDVLNYPLNIPTGGPSLSTGMGLKLDLETVNHYTEATQLKSQSNEKIIKTIMKERNRVGFVSNVLHTMLELNLFNKTAVAAFMTLKRLHQLLESLKKDISIENSLSKFKVLDKWAEFQISDDYLAFSRYVNEEMEEANSFLNIFKQEISVLTSSNPSDNDLKDPIFKMEKLNSGVDMKYLHTILLSYAEDVRNLAQEKVRSGDDAEGMKLFVHANEVLDCDNLDEFFERTLDGQVLKLNEQPYFMTLKMTGKEKIQDMVGNKLTSSKIRIF